MLRGNLEHADRSGVAGWARDGDAPLTLEVFADGVALAVVQADQYRPDLRDAGLGAGCHGFSAWFADALPPGRAVTLAVCRPDGSHLPGSPRTLAAEAPPATAPRRPDAGRKLALVVDEAAPDPARDAGSAALLSHMAALEALGYTVRFAALGDLPAALEATAGLVRVAYLYRLRPAQQAERIRARNPGAWLVYSVAELAHLRAERQALVLGGVAPRGLRAAELAAARAADAVVTHSPAEAVLLERALPGRRAHWVPWATPAAPPGVPFAQRAGIGFIGSYGHAPNLDAARVLLERVMPLVWQHRAIPCVLAGHGMPDWLAARAGPLVRVLHPLPAAAAFWRSIRVSAAPLRFGAGVKGKVLDSLAAGVPCVCAPLAAEALALPAALLAADPAAMAARLLALHEDAAAHAQAAAAGRAALHDSATVARALAWALAER